MTGPIDVRNSISTSLWGQDLNGNSVTSQSTYLSAVATLRTSNGHNQTFPWQNPIIWSKFTSAMLSQSGVTGSTV